MKHNQNINLLFLFALIFAGCSSSEKLFSVSNPKETPHAGTELYNTDKAIELEYKPSTNALNKEGVNHSHEITYFTSNGVEATEILKTDNDLIINTSPEALPDTLPTSEWLSQSQLARESKIAGIWGLALFIILPYISIVLGVIALSKGTRAKRTIARSPESYINANDAVAGIIMGSIIVGLFVLGLLVLTVYLLAASGLINLPQW